MWTGFCAVTLVELSPKLHCHPVMLPELVSLNFTANGAIPVETFGEKLAEGDDVLSSAMTVETETTINAAIISKKAMLIGLMSHTSAGASHTINRR